MRLTEGMPAVEVVSIECPDEDTPCSQCSRPAAWWRDCASCGNTVWVCEPHRLRSDQWVARQTGRIGCKRCRVEFPRPIPPWNRLR